jgi:hypothetical protein
MTSTQYNGKSNGKMNNDDESENENETRKTLSRVGDNFANELISSGSQIGTVHSPAVKQRAVEFTSELDKVRLLI